MLNSRDFIARELDEHRKMKRDYEKKLNRLPKGRLSMSNAKGHGYYYRVEEKQKIYIGNESAPEVQALKLRAFLEHSIENITVNIKLMEKFRKISHEGPKT